MRPTQRQAPKLIEISGEVGMSVVVHKVNKKKSIHRHDVSESDIVSFLKGL